MEDDLEDEDSGSDNDASTATLEELSEPGTTTRTVRMSRSIQASGRSGNNLGDTDENAYQSAPAVSSENGDKRDELETQAECENQDIGALVNLGRHRIESGPGEFTESPNSFAYLQKLRYKLFYRKVNDPTYKYVCDSTEAQDPRSVSKKDERDALSCRLQGLKETKEIVEQEISEVEEQLGNAEAEKARLEGVLYASLDRSGINKDL